MAERHNHGKNLIGTVRIELLAKSCVLRVHDVLADTTRTSQFSLWFAHLPILTVQCLWSLISKGVRGRCIAMFIVQPSA